MPKTFEVKNLARALALAKKFKASGRYSLFRGQAQNWPVVPSLGRISKRKIKDTQDKIKRLYYFFGTNSNLKKYRKNIDWFFAVAQHYGLPTQYIDFSESVEVAAFFATNSKANKIGENCAIICLNEDDLKSFVEFTKFIYTDNKEIPPYIARVSVDNLWRLQAQQGCFLFTPYVNIDSLYGFDRIIFPFSEPFNKLCKEEVYPERKSELEILLDQYFTVERKQAGFERLKIFAEKLNIPTKTITPRDYRLAIKKNNEHYSWRSSYFKAWNFEFKEEWNNYRGGTSILRLKLKSDEDIKIQIESISKQLASFLEDNKIKRTDFLQFEVITKPKLTKKLAHIINRSCIRIWDGTRNLPYTDREIAYMIGKYICLELYKHKFEMVPSLTKEQLVSLELVNKYGSNTRCDIPSDKIILAFRNDIKDILIDELTHNICSEILLHINIPALVFDFKKLVGLFKDEMISSQVLRCSRDENPVIFYTPAQIAKLGYA